MLVGRQISESAQNITDAHAVPDSAARARSGSVYLCSRCLLYDFGQNEFKILSELHWPRYTIGSLDESQLAEVLELTGRLPLLLDSFVTAWLKVCVSSGP